MRVTVFAMVLAILGTAAPAMANEKDDADIRCIVAFLNQAGADSSQADSASYVAAYFYGKLFTRNPGKAPAALVTDQSLPTTQAVLQADLRRCGSEFADARKKIEALNGELLARAQKSGGLPGAPNPGASAPRTPALPDIGAQPWQGQRP